MVQEGGELWVIKTVRWSGRSEIDIIKNKQEPRNKPTVKEDVLKRFGSNA